MTNQLIYRAIAILIKNGSSIKNPAQILPALAAGGMSGDDVATIGNLTLLQVLEGLTVVDVLRLMIDAADQAEGKS